MVENKQTTHVQQLLPMKQTETRLAKVERLLGTIPKINRGSATMFDYDRATAIARSMR